MKANTRCVIDSFKKDISIAKADSYKAILLPFDLNYEPYYLDFVDDIDYIYDVAYDFGWDRSLLINFEDKKEVIIDLYELEIA